MTHGRISITGVTFLTAFPSMTLGQTLKIDANLAAAHCMAPRAFMPEWRRAVAPGEIKTAMISPEYEALVPRIPMNRIGTPEDVAAAVHYLVGEDSSYVTGTEIFVTGGQHLY
mgnify:CR=1 FL=1